MGMNRKEKLLPLDRNERIYQEYFRLCPEVYDALKYLYHDWEEFSEIYAKNAEDSSVRQKAAPTYMDGELKENDWFPGNEDVSMMLNARFCPPFWHHLNFIKITYVLGGECAFFVKGRKKYLKEGSFVIVPPDVEQTVFSCHENDIVINIFIRKSTFENAFSSLLAESRILAQFFWRILYGNNESSVIYVDGCKDKKMDEMILDMYEDVRAGVPNRNFLLISNVMHFLAHVLAYHQDKLEFLREERLEDKTLPDIIHYIRENYDTVTLTHLAEHFHKSEGYLCRYIRQETGYSLTVLLKKYRMKQAALMLRDSESSVESIMHQVGYTDISYFYRTFKKHYGMTPINYRNQGKIIQL